MGTDIHGWVEVQHRYPGVKPPYDARWDGVIKIDGLLVRNYDMFSCLFGVTSYVAFDPIARARKLPDDISEEASADYLHTDAVYGETWVAWEDIEAIDWLENALDSRPHQYERDASGKLVYVTKAAPRVSDVIKEEYTWQVDAITYRIERMERREALSADWILLFRLMKTLSEVKQGSNVRLVVWFDQ